MQPDRHFMSPLSSKSYLIHFRSKIFLISCCFALIWILSWTCFSYPFNNSVFLSSIFGLVELLIICSILLMICTILSCIGRKRAEKFKCAYEQALKELTASKEQLEDIFKNAPIGIYKTTPEGKIIMANPMLIKMLGFDSFDDLVKRDLSKNGFTNSHPRGEFLKMFENSDRVVGYETSWKKKDGSIIYIRENSRAIKDEKGKILFFEGTVEDITDRVESQKKLQETQEQLNLILNTVEEIVVYHDKDLRIKWANQSAAKSLNVTQEILIGSYCYQAWHGRDKICENCPVDKSIKTGLSKHAEIKTPDGRYWWISSTPVFDDKGNTIGAVEAAQDITERKNYQFTIEKLNAELEQRVRERTMQLEASNQELEAFSYSISHDLRGPLRHIKGFAQMLRETTEHLLSPEHKKYIDNINRSVAEMSNLIDALLNFSRLGRAEINKIKIDLNTIVQDIIKHENEVCSLKKINWIIAALPEVYADPILLKQVFNNYISNAIKYSRNSPDPTIEIGFDDSNPNEFIFYVKDNGVGFDMKYADKLFCVFQRLHSSSEFEGVGIGLANVRRIVSRHGGRVWAQSQPNKGATFFFSLPK